MKRCTYVLWTSMFCACGAPGMPKEIADSFAHRCFDEVEENDFEAKPVTAPFLNVAVLQDVNSKGTIYDRNLSGGLREYMFPTDESGTLRNDIFSVESPLAVDAFNEDFDFTFDPKEDAFDQTSMFVNATFALKWFQGNGAKIPEGEIILRLDSPAQQTNNALYTPAQNGQPAAITVGRGDDRVLANLRTDRDVIWHELSHHILFRKLTETRGDSLMLHEGLADLFTAVNNDDPCIAASICPAGTGACAQNTCLRTTDNDLMFERNDLPPHLQSQALSGMLWDLKEEASLADDDLLVMIFHAIEAMSLPATLDQFLEALKDADRKLFGGQNVEHIDVLAQSRGAP